MDDAAVKRLVTAIRTALPTEAGAAEIRVSLLPGMILVRINADPGGNLRSFISKEGG